MSVPVPNQGFTSIPTSAVRVVQTEHGRMRRRQRAITKKDLQRAVKYGTRTPNYPRPNGDPTARIVYKDITYIMNERTGEEVTSYANPIPLEKVPINVDQEISHVRALLMISDKAKWKSNTVICVDTSGSMKAADVWGTRTRLKAVWLSVALDFVAHRIESGEAGDLDVISIISLGETSQVLVEEWPTTWVLYNKIVEFYMSSTFRPSGHGYYLPSIEKAEELLNANSNASCAMGLLFISDGRPSDHRISKIDIQDSYGFISERIGLLAKQFGRRLQFDAVGIGDFENFDALQAMVDCALDFGAKASFRLPSMSTNDLGDVLNSFATSMTSTQTEMTDMATSKQQCVRKVLRESKTKAKMELKWITNDDFYLYSVDYVDRKVYRERVEDRRVIREFRRVNFQHPDTKFVALNKEAFGEGAERFAYRFYEVASDATTLLGKPLVAKESRFVIEQNVGDEDLRRKYIKTFVSTQTFARRYAKSFNEKLDRLHSVDSSTPRIEFLACSIYRLDDINIGRLSVLVEERLDESKWEKWNANNGYVKGMKSVPKFNEDILQETMNKMGNLELGGIEEGDEEEEEDEDEDDSQSEEDQDFKAETYTPFEVAQAFSHYSYEATGRTRLICDLQGNFDKKKNMLRLSDPVIHSDIKGRFNYGRTDRGLKGMAMFFETHECSKLCSLTIKGFKKRYHQESEDSTKKECFVI